MIKNRLARGIVRYRHVLLVLILIGTVLSAGCIGKTKINYDLTRYLSDDTMTKRALAVMQSEFSSSEQLRVMFTDQDAEAMAQYTASLNELPEVLIAAHDAESDVVDPDGHRYQLVSVTLNACDTRETVNKLRGMFPQAGQYYVGGAAADQIDIQRSIGREIPGVMAIAVAVVLLMLLITSHAWLEPLVIVIVLAVSIVINMGTNFLFPDVSFITFAVCAILQLALSIDYAIMLLHTFHAHLPDAGAAEEAMAEALAECFMRISSSALTTVAGLLSLLFMSFTIGFDIGMVLSKGILFSLLGVFLLMPSVVLLMQKPLQRTMHAPVKLGGAHLARGIRRFRKPLAAGMILLVAAGLYCNTQVSFSFTSTQTLSNSDSALIRQRFGASNPLVILVTGGETDEDYDRQRLLVEKLESIRMDNGERALASVSAMVTTGAAALEYYTPASVAELTGQSRLAVNLFFLANGFGESVRADRLLAAASGLSDDAQILQLQSLLASARSAFIGSSHARLLAEVNFSVSDPNMSRYMEQILAAVSAVYPEDYYVTGNAMSNYDISHAFRSDLVKVNLITLLAIALIVLLSFRSPGITALLVFVIEGAIWITMGISRIAGQPIFFISYLICLSIQMGATIDYGILLSDQYRLQRQSGSEPEAALTEALRRSLPTIITSGIILIVAGYIIGKQCSIFYISSIGLLVSRGALVSVILVLTLLPAALLLCDRIVIRHKTDN